MGSVPRNLFEATKAGGNPPMLRTGLRCTVLVASAGVWYILSMREWLRERFMRRRSRRPPNESESTGKIGQELPTDQPAPLRPTYPEPLKAEPAVAAQQQSEPETEEPQTEVTSELHGLQPGEVSEP